MGSALLPGTALVLPGVVWQGYKTLRVVALVTRTGWLYPNREVLPRLLALQVALERTQQLPRGCQPRPGVVIVDVAANQVEPEVPGHTAQPPERRKSPKRRVAERCREVLNLLGCVGVTASHALELEGVDFVPCLPALEKVGTAPFPLPVDGLRNSKHRQL